MSDLRRRIDRKLRDAGTRRFAREIGASVLATLIGGALVSYATREGPAPAAQAPKSSERLAALALPERAATIPDAPALAPRTSVAATSVATMPIVQAGATVIPPRATTRPVEAAPRRPMTVVALPPVRPAERAILADAGLTPAAREPASREPTSREPLRIFGWGVPGSDLLPTGAEAAQKVSDLGRQVASLGGTIGERVGLR